MIHVLRPYASEEEYLASERFSIDSRSMLLIDQPPLPVETPIVFDVQLENGQKPIRAEAKVIGHVEASADKPGGLRVRFKRFGAATKAFIDRAIAQPSIFPATAAEAASERPVSIGPVPSLVPEAASAAAPSAAAAPAEFPSPAALMPAPERRESSGIHRRLVAPVAAPVNREELLERLRTRARNAIRTRDAQPDEQTG